MAVNPGFQISLDVMGRPCLVLGGDEEAAEKVHRLLQAGAKVTVISPTLSDVLRKLAASGKIIHRVRTFRASDAEGVTLVINTVKHDTDYGKALYDLALKERFLLCSTDRPDLSTCMMPAVVARGLLRLAVSTSGASPALASRLRQDLEAVFDEEFEGFLGWLQKLRDDTQASETDAEDRRRQLRQAVEGFKLAATVSYPPEWQAVRAEATTRR